MAADRPKLVKVKVNDSITVSIPREWNAMDALDFTQRYPSVRAPLAAYTNLDRTIDFSINISATQWPDTDLELAQKFFKASVLSMFDRVEMIGTGVGAHAMHDEINIAGKLFDLRIVPRLAAILERERMKPKYV